MSGWPPKIRFRRAAKVGDNYATPSETEKISVLLKNSVCNEIKLEKIAQRACDRAKRERLPRDVAFVEQRDFQALRAGESNHDEK